MERGATPRKLAHEGLPATYASTSGMTGTCVQDLCILIAFFYAGRCVPVSLLYCNALFLGQSALVALFCYEAHSFPGRMKLLQLPNFEYLDVQA